MKLDTNIQQYANYVNSHVEEIARCVDARFEKDRIQIKGKIVEEIKSYITPLPVHFEIKRDNNPFDRSGVLVEDGDVTLNQTIMDFLQNEYTGNKTATYMSGMGWSYDTYEDELGYLTLEMSYEIMILTIREHIESHYCVKLSDDEFEDIKCACYDFDDIYMDCIANEFCCPLEAIKFVGIGDIKLSSFVNLVHMI